MVLSNKKLKQKIRAQLVESLTSLEFLKNQSDSKDPQTLQSVKSLLNSAVTKPKLSKREKRRVKIPSVQGGSELENQTENGVKEKESTGNGELKKTKKRKREKEKTEKDVETEEKEVKDLSEKKSSKKKKKKKKNKKKKVKKEGEEVVEKANGVTEEQVVTDAEAIHTHNSKEEVGISTKVYVGGIPYYSTVDDIRSFFEGCGSITEIDCLKFPETGKFNGIAMISFRTEAAAKRALALDGSDMGGLLLKIQPYKSTRDKKVSDFAPAIMEGYNRIYVGNLSWDITENEIKKLFSDCTISSIRLGKDKETGDFRGFAHVDFADSLSLTMALKLDQKPIFGRPVRIRCAVPPKSTKPISNSEPNVSKKEDNNVKANDFTFERTIEDTDVNDDEKDSLMGKIKRTCYECGEKGHLSSSCPKKQNADVAKQVDDVALAEDDNMVNSISDGKLKRRTCYECGERGHLSSLCPKKQAADLANSGKEAYGEALTFMGQQEVDKEMVNSVSDGKLRRRTCYECGEKGHLSSLCPKKQAADVAKSGKEVNGIGLEGYTFVGQQEVDKEMVNAVSDGKLRRRTCYECGERGHLSSLCPKKQNADVADSIKEANGMEIEKKADNNNVANAVSGGKIRRRTCYECGEKGHLSSACPNKKEADLTNPNLT